MDNKQPEAILNPASGRSAICQQLVGNSSIPKHKVDDWPVVISLAADQF